MIRWTIAIFLLLGPTLVSGAQPRAATVTGTILDQGSGDPVAFVAVILDGGDFLRNANTNESGRFRIEDVPPGRYRINLTRIGYEPMDTELIVPEGQAEITFDTQMTSRPIVVDKVEVLEDRLRREQQMQTGFVKLEAEDVLGVPALGEADPIRTLQLLPGVQAASDISSGLYIRGGGPDQTAILFDQVPIYNPTHAFGLFSTFNADVIDDVTLYKGAYPAQYGGRLGSVVDIRSRGLKPPEFRGKASVSIISAKALVEGPIGRGSWMLSGRRTYLDPLLKSLQKNDSTIPDYYFFDLNGKAAFRTGENGRFEINAYGGQDKITFDLDADSFIDLWWGNRLGSVSYIRRMGENTLGSVALSGSEYRSGTDSKIFTTPFDFTNRLRDLTLRGDLTWEASEEHRLRAGLQVSQYHFSFEQNFNNDLAFVFDSKPFETSGYVEDQWSPGSGTTLRGGLRTRYVDEGSRLLFEPRLSISRGLGERFRLKLGGGVYHQFLQLVTTEGFSAGDFYFPLDETTELGRSLQAVLGLEFEPSIAYQLSGEVYLTDLANLVLLDNDVPVDQTSTAAADIFKTDGDGYAAGVELFAQKRTGRITGWIGYTLGWTRRKFADVNQGSVFPPKYDRRHDLNLVGKYRSGKWNFGGSFIYATGQAFTPAAARYGIRDPATGIFEESGNVLAADKNSGRLLAYHRLDVSVTRDFQMFGNPAQWFVQIYNLYSRRNEWFVQFDTVGQPEVVKQLPIIPSIGIRFDF